MQRLLGRRKSPHHAQTDLPVVERQAFSLEAVEEVLTLIFQGGSLLDLRNNHVTGTDEHSVALGLSA